MATLPARPNLVRLEKTARQRLVGLRAADPGSRPADALLLGHDARDTVAEYLEKLERGTS